MHLGPAAGVLLREPHPCLHTDYELCEMFRKAPADDFVQPSVFVFREVPSSSLWLLAVVDRTSRIGLSLAVPLSAAIAQREKCSVAVPGGRRLASGAQPALNLLRTNL